MAADQYDFDNLIIDGFDMEKASKLASGTAKKSFCGLLILSGGALFIFQPFLGAALFALGAVSLMISPVQKTAKKFMKKYYSALSMKKNHSLYELSLILSVPSEKLMDDLSMLIEKGIIKLNKKSIRYVGRPQPKLRPINQPKEEAADSISYDLSSIKQKRALSQIDEFRENLHLSRSRISRDDEIIISLDETERTLSAIYECIEKDEESLVHAGRLFSYYLPTLQKLLDAYTDKDGHHTKQAKDQIRDLFGTASKGFKKILASFEQKSDIDVTSEIAAMEQIMAIEGIAETDTEESALKTLSHIPEEMQQ